MKYKIEALSNNGKWFFQVFLNGRLIGESKASYHTECGAEFAGKIWSESYIERMDQCQY